MVYDGAIYGVPILRPCMNFTNFVNQNLMDSIGAEQPKNGDDYKRLLKEFTRPQSNLYGIARCRTGLWPAVGRPRRRAAPAHVPGAQQLVRRCQRQAHQGPGDGPVQGRAGLHPRPVRGRVLLSRTRRRTRRRVRQNLVGGKYAIAPTGWAAYAPFMWDVGIKANPPVKFRALRPFSVDGGKPIWNQFSGVNGLTAVKKGSTGARQGAARHSELLRRAVRLGGVPPAELRCEGRPLDLRRQRQSDSDRQREGRPADRVCLVVPRRADAGAVRSERPRVRQAAYEDQQAFVSVLQPDPTWGLYSPTDNGKGGQLTQRFSDGIGEIVAGRNPLSSLDDLIRELAERRRRADAHRVSTGLRRRTAERWATRPSVGDLRVALTGECDAQSPADAVPRAALSRAARPACCRPTCASPTARHNSTTTSTRRATCTSRTCGATRS